MGQLSATDAPANPAPAGPRGGTGLVLAPFPGWRFSAEVVGDLGGVLAPPYDVLDVRARRAVPERGPYSVARITGAVGAREAARAAELVRAWHRAGALHRDAPGLYVVETTAGGMAQRALVGALDPSSTVLPHEDVAPGPVQARRHLMAATGLDVEPILLVHSGGGAATDAVVSAEASGQLLVEIDAGSAADGRSHRLWHLTEPHLLRAIADDLRHRTPLIADGHHRWAAARAHRASLPEGASGSILAALVDDSVHPLQLAGLHRLVRGLDVQDAVAAVARQAEAVELPADAPVPALLSRLEPSTRASVVLVGRSSAVALSARRAANTAADTVATRWVHQELLPACRGVSDADITYVHDAGTAVADARAGAGTAVLVPPVGVGAVSAVVAAGGRLPRKSTSFGPKPVAGLVMLQHPWVGGW